MKSLLSWYIVIVTSLLTCWIAQNSFAQQTITIAGKSNVIPAFKESVPEAKYSDFHSVVPIEQSRHTMDIRLSFSAGMSKAMIALRGNKDSLWADCYYYSFIPGMKRSPASGLKQLKTHEASKTSGFTESIDLTGDRDSIFESLLRNNIFTLEDEKVLLDSLTINNIPFKNEAWLDGYWSCDFTIKVNEQFRRFNISPGTDRQNPTMDVFAKRLRLYTLFFDLYRSSGLPVPGW